MKIVKLKTVVSTQHPDLLSIRGRDGSVGTFRRDLAANFEAGEDVVIISEKDLNTLVWAGG